jgi:nucleotide-binding universal stress UspA family protein
LKTQLENANIQLLGLPQRSLINKILVPIDGSACSDEAVQFAMRLAAKYGAEICFFHVIPAYQWRYCFETPEWSIIPIYPIRKLEEEAEKLLLSTMTSVEEANIKVHAELDYGSPANRIVRMAKEGGFDLIVMASSGLGFLGRLVFGSVSDEVVHRAPCPVLVMKAHRKVSEEKEADEQGEP